MLDSWASNFDRPFRCVLRPFSVDLLSATADIRCLKLSFKVKVTKVGTLQRARHRPSPLASCSLLSPVSAVPAIVPVTVGSQSPRPPYFLNNVAELFLGLIFISLACTIASLISDSATNNLDGRHMREITIHR